MVERNRLTLQYLAISLLLFSITIGVGQIGVDFCYSARFVCGAICLFTTTPFFFFGITCFTLAWLPLSRHHTWATAIAHFLLLVMIRIIGARFYDRFEKAAKNPRQTQEKLLKRLLNDNVNTEYGKLHGFSNIKDSEDFRAKHPLTTYEVYRPYIDRIAEKGEQNLLTRDIVDKFNLSSGTTGKCKLLPSTTGYFRAILLHMFIPYIYLLTKFKRDSFFAPLKTSFKMYVPQWRYSPSNIPMGPMTGFSKKHQSLLIKLNRTLPSEAEVYLSEVGQSYLHWLFALYDRDLVRIDGAYAGIMLCWLEALQKNWQRLVADIRQGRIDRSNPEIPMDVIEKIEKAGLLWPDPKRADELHAEFSRGFEGVISRLWPRANLVTSITTGAQAIYVERLQWFCGPSVKIFSPAYAASETGIIAMNVDIDDVQQFYTLLPQMAFMEFIPEEDMTSNDPQTLFIDQLQKGHRYELVVTSMLGFYRYRLGDVLEVVRHRHDATPVVRFCGRTGTLIDLRGEKTSEDMVLVALKKTVQQWEGFRSLEDYTTTDCVSCSKGAKTADGGGLFYVLFVEADGVARPLTPEEVSVFDQCLAEVSLSYKSMRSRDALVKPKVFTVKKGTFAQIKEVTLKRNAAVSTQYKTPRYMTDEERLLLLLQSSY